MMRAAKNRAPFRIFACLSVVILLAGVVQAPLLTFYRISGSSMCPSFADGDRVLVTSLGSVEVGDAVIARHGGEALIKRVVAGPGDTVELLGGVLFRNGRMAEEVVPPRFLDRSYQPLRYLARGEYFLLGDNRRVSVDSRYFGPIEQTDIVGRVVYRWFDADRGRTVTAAEK